MQTRAAVRGLRKDGTEFPIEVAISKIYVEDKVELTAVIRDISEKNKLLEERLIASREDPLTKLFNRRHFTEILASELQRSRRFKRFFGLIMVDIDHFKSINDTYGHECGDLALLELTKVFKQSLGDIDIVCRWGGEEFIIILPETDLHSTTGVAEKIRATAEAHAFVYNQHTVRYTISMGVVESDHDNENVDAILNRVDKLLYRAKDQGRNRVIAE